MDEKQQAAVTELFGVVANIVRAQNPGLAARLLEDRGLFVSKATESPAEADVSTQQAESPEKPPDDPAPQAEQRPAKPQKS